MSPRCRALKTGSSARRPALARAGGLLGSVAKANTRISQVVCDTLAASATTDSHERYKPMKTPHNLTRTIAGALVSGGLAVAGLGLAAPAQAGPSYWHYCPGHWEYTVPVPPGTDMSVCHWFA